MSDLSAQPTCDATIEDGGDGRLRCQLADGHDRRHYSTLADGHGFMEWTDQAEFAAPAASSFPRLTAGLTPAQELRTAAEKLRAAATEASHRAPGPWIVHEANGFLRVDNDRDKTKEAWTMKTGADLAEENRPTAEYIALMHPWVGKLLADLLETTADYYRPGVHHPTHVVRALAVAREILTGGDQ